MGTSYGCVSLLTAPERHDKSLAWAFSRPLAMFDDSEPPQAPVLHDLPLGHVGEPSGTRPCAISEAYRPLFIVGCNFDGSRPRGLRHPVAV